MNVYRDGLRICTYDTAAGVGGFVEETRRGGRLLGFINAPDQAAADEQIAQLVAAAEE